MKAQGAARTFRSPWVSCRKLQMNPDEDKGGKVETLAGS